MAAPLDTLTPSLSLADLSRGGEPRPPRLLIYGTKGIGKSTLAASAPSPVFLDVEDGLTSIPVSRWRIFTFEAALDAIEVLLRRDAHEFQTVAIDSLDHMERLVWAAVCRSYGVDTIEKVEKGYGRGYVIALDLWRDFLAGLEALRDQCGMGVVMIAHHEIRRFDSPESEPYDRYQLKLHKLAAGLVQESVDAVLFANYRISTVEKDVGFNKKVTRAVGGGARALHTTERPAWSAKNRYAMPDSLPMEWSAIAEHVPFYTAKIPL